MSSIRNFDIFTLSSDLESNTDINKKQNFGKKIADNTNPNSVNNNHLDNHFYCDFMIPLHKLKRNKF